MCGAATVRGIACHHLRLVQEDLDWQVWVDVGDRPLPRKLVITYKRLPLAPQFAAVLSDWELAPRLSDERFAFEAPEGALRVEMVGSKLPAGADKEDQR